MKTKLGGTCPGRTFSSSLKEAHPPSLKVQATSSPAQHIRRPGQEAAGPCSSPRTRTFAMLGGLPEGLRRSESSANKYCRDCLRVHVCALAQSRLLAELQIAVLLFFLSLSLCAIHIPFRFQTERTTKVLLMGTSAIRRSFGRHFP